jgi:hypothetical protein
MMEAASTSETSVNFCWATRCNNPEDSHLKVEIVCSSCDQMLLRSVFDYFLHVLLSENHNAARHCACGSDPESFARCKAVSIHNFLTIIVTAVI